MSLSLPDYLHTKQRIASLLAKPNTPTSLSSVPVSDSLSSVSFPLSPLSLLVSRSPVLFDHLRTLEQVVTDELKEHGVKFSFDSRVKACIGKMKEEMEGMRIGVERWKQEYCKSSVVKKEKEQEMEMGRMRQVHADLIRKIKYQNEKVVEKLEKKVESATAEAMESARKEVEMQKEKWTAVVRKTTEEEFSKITNERAAMIEEKLSKLEKEYDHAIKLQLGQTNQEKLRADRNEKVMLEERRMRMDALKKHEAYKSEMLGEIEKNRKDFQADHDELLLAQAQIEQEKAELEKKYAALIQMHSLDSNRLSKSEKSLQMMQLKMEESQKLFNQQRENELAEIDVRIRTIIDKKDQQIRQLQEELLHARKELEAARMFLEFTKADVSAGS